MSSDDAEAEAAKLFALAIRARLRRSKLRVYADGGSGLYSIAIPGLDAHELREWLERLGHGDAFRAALHQTATPRR